MESRMRPLDDFEVPSAPFLSGVAAAGDEVTVPHPSSGLPVSFTLPLEYRKGDSVRVRCPSHATTPAATAAAAAAAAAASSSRDGSNLLQQHGHVISEIPGGVSDGVGNDNVDDAAAGGGSNSSPQQQQQQQQQQQSLWPALHARA
jgi:hypothetical protein